MSAPTTVLFDAPGPKSRARHAIIGVIGALAILALLFLIIRGLANPKNNQLTGALWSPFVHGGTWTAYLLPGLLSTLKAAALAIVLSLIGGIALGLGRLSRVSAVRWACGVFVEFFRAVPVLVMMLFAYYFAVFVLHLTQNQPFFGVVVGLFFYNASVIAELVRSGVHSLPRGQREAGLAVGLTESQAMWSVLLPQAITAMLPSLVSQLVVVLKDTALGYIIGYYDFVRAGQTMSNLYGNLIPTMIVTAAVFIIINYSLTRVAGWLERRLRSRGRDTVPADTLAGEQARPADAAAV
jgi:glutamate transport system permease protein